MRGARTSNPPRAAEHLPPQVSLVVPEQSDRIRPQVQVGPAGQAEPVGRCAGCALVSQADRVGRTVDEQDQVAAGSRHNPSDLRVSRGREPVNDLLATGQRQVVGPVGRQRDRRVAPIQPGAHASRVDEHPRVTGDQRDKLSPQNRDVRVELVQDVDVLRVHVLDVVLFDVPLVVDLQDIAFLGGRRGSTERIRDHRSRCARAAHHLRSEPDPAAFPPCDRVDLGTGEQARGSSSPGELPSQMGQGHATVIVGRTFGRTRGQVG